MQPKCRILVAGALLVTLNFGATPLRAQNNDPRPHFYNKVICLCIGINDYKYDIPDLSQAEADATLFGETLRRSFGYEAVYVTGPDATKANILAKIAEHGNGLGLDDALILYFSGHGVAFDRVRQVDNLPLPERVGYLLPYDADVILNNSADPGWDHEAINMRELVDLVDTLKAHHVVVVADSCCSGFMTKRGFADVGEQINLLKNPSRSVVAATTQHEQATEGVFTKLLLDVVKRYSKNLDVASLTDLFDEVRGPVIAKAGRRMTPQMSHIGDADGEFIFFPLGINSASVKAIKQEVEKERRKQPTAPLAAAGKGLLKGVFERQNRRAGRKTTVAEVAAAMSAPNYWYGSKAKEKTAYWSAMRKRFLRNAAWGDALAMVGLHFCYVGGLGEPQKQTDPQAAYRWALVADQIKVPAGVGKYLLGRCYRHGLGVKKNERAGRTLYAQSAKDGFILGKIANAELTLFNSHSPAEARQAVRTLNAALALKIPSAAVVLGDVYATGKYGIQQNLARAVELYEKAVDLGHLGATLPLFDAYSRGAPGYPEKDLPRAEAYLRQGAEAGIGDCQFFLGIELLQTPGSDTVLGLMKNPMEALRWLEIAAEQENLRALVDLADQFGCGRDPNLGTDVEKARKYVEQAVALNSSPALVVQGNFYLGDYGVYEHNEKKALKCFERAAALDDPKGCELAGRLYYAGIGVELPDKFRVPDALHPKSHVAMHWFMKAVQIDGNEHSESQLKRFSDLIRRENRGIVTTPGFEPSFVLGIWKQTFPATAKLFEKSFLNEETIGNKVTVSDGTRVGPDTPAVETRAVALKLQEQGFEFLKSKQYDRAYEVLSKSIAQNPSNCNTFLLRGNAAKQLGNRRDALADYTKAIRLNPKEWKFYVNRASLLWDMKDFVGMRRDAEMAIRLNPDYGKSHILLGNAHFRLGDFDRAIAAYDAAIASALDANLKPQAYHNRGAAWERKGEQSKAERDFRRARQLGFGR